MMEIHMNANIQEQPSFIETGVLHSISNPYFDFIKEK